MFRQTAIQYNLPHTRHMNELLRLSSLDPNKNRGNIFKVATYATFISIAFLLVALVFNLGIDNGKAKGKYEANSATYENYGKEEIRNCFALDNDDAKAECIISSSNAYNEQERSEANLAIQTQMATWTFGMLVTTMLTTGVTAIGVWYVRATLVQANLTNAAAVSAASAANDANLIMRQEARPWVTIKREVLCEINDTGFGLRVSWNYDLVNKGKSPAYDVKIDWKVVKRGHLQGLYDEAKSYANLIISKPRLKGAPIIFPSEKTELIKYSSNGWSRYDYNNHDSEESNDGDLLMFICLSYRLSLNSSEFGAEVIVVGFEKETRWLGPYASKMLEYSSARFIQ